VFFLSLLSYYPSAALRLWTLVRLWTLSDSDPGNSFHNVRRRSFWKHNSTPLSFVFSHLQGQASEIQGKIPPFLFFIRYVFLFLCYDSCCHKQLNLLTIVPRWTPSFCYDSCFSIFLLFVMIQVFLLFCYDSCFSIVYSFSLFFLLCWELN